jgi:hypothetical protein
VSPDGVRVAFELDRFELTGEDRLEIAGRWFGVRGLRFVRPSLIVQTDEGERSLLAVLEHKPWAAEEGQSWVAAFPWKGDSPDPGQTELAVAPSVVVALEGRKEKRDKQTAKGGRRPTLRDRLEGEEKRARRLDSEVAWLREEREALIADKRAAEAEGRRLADELDGVREELDTALRERDEALRERSDALRACDQAVRERDSAARARDEAASDRDVALAARQQALAELEEALHEQEAAVRHREQLARRHEELVAERDEAVAGRITAFAERDAALGRGSGFPAISAADLGRQPRAPGADAPRRGDDWTARAVALGALVTLLLLVIVLLKFL